MAYGLWLRRKLPETLHSGGVTNEHPLVGRSRLELIRDNSGVIVLALVVLAAGAVGSYVFS